MTASAMVRSVTNALFYAPNTIRYAIDMVRLCEAIAQLGQVFERHGLRCERTDWFMTKDILRITAIIWAFRGVFPRIILLRELRTTTEQWRTNGPYSLLGLFHRE